uniref:Uncharacterized protein n=1 Tax=viral metagenome TaxID=1070528 RepID=A0A6M3LW46_9ZZZZ
MSKMAEFEAGIREIARKIAKEEIRLYDNRELQKPWTGEWTAEKRDNVNKINHRENIIEREGIKWSTFETDMLVESFWNFCGSQAIRSGRSSRSISCKVRNLMHSGAIITW